MGLKKKLLVSFMFATGTLWVYFICMNITRDPQQTHHIIARWLLQLCGSLISLLSEMLSNWHEVSEKHKEMTFRSKCGAV